VSLGNWTWIDGLSANLWIVAGLSRAHLERLLRSVRQVSRSLGQSVIQRVSVSVSVPMSHAVT
jgi:hypothetical protein